MHPAAALPPVFTVAEGLGAGLSSDVLDGPGYIAPLHGLRHRAGASPAFAETIRALQRCLPHSVATDATAARLWGMWLPASREHGPVHLARTRETGGAPRRAGVVGHELHPDTPVVTVRGICVTGPEDTWAALARSGLRLEDLVACGDSLLQRPDGPAARREPGVHPRTTVAALTTAAHRARGRRGMRTVRAAPPLLRSGSDSRRETLLRLAIVAAGFEEPQVNPEILLSDGSTTHLDLAWPGRRVCIQYEGDQHRTDPDQWRRDIERDRRLQADGWIVLRVAASAFTARGWRALLHDLEVHLGEPQPR